MEDTRSQAEDGEVKRAATTAVTLRAGGSTGGGDVKIQELLWELEAWRGGSTRVGSPEEGRPGEEAAADGDAL